VLLERATGEHVVEVVELVVSAGALGGDALVEHLTTEETIEFAVNKDNHVNLCW